MQELVDERRIDPKAWIARTSLPSFVLLSILLSITTRYQKTVRLVAFVSLDEATVSSRSNWLRACQYNPMKPREFRLKLFMTCCAVTGYFYSLEVYQGKQRDTNKPYLANHEDMSVARLDDASMSPAAMLRNCLWMKGSHVQPFVIDSIHL